jgi:hypothetical protein
MKCNVNISDSSMEKQHEGKNGEKISLRKCNFILLVGMFGAHFQGD